MFLNQRSLRYTDLFVMQRCFRGGNMRLGTFIFPKISHLCCRSKHKLPRKFLGKVDAFDNVTIPELKLLKKVTAVVGYDGIDDYIKDDLCEKCKDENDDFDVLLACKRFPSISLGFAPPIELYDGSTSSIHGGLLASQFYQQYLLHTSESKVVDPNHLYETWPSLRPSNSSSVGEELDTSPVCSLPILKPESRQDDELNVNKSSTSSAVIDTPNASTSIQEILDKPIKLVPGLTKRQSNQLENCGFYTLRKLLYHYPRTYADLQNPEVTIVDGQYMIFVGKILSSRGIRASSSFSFLEVVVACEVGESSLNSECMIDGTEESRTRTMYIHLKKFFRGARFTFLPFLKSLESKHQEGEIVCVSGKVRVMRTKDHYEMREYTLDILQDEGDSAAFGKEKLYPIYPSKGGLKPNFLRDIISRGLQSLPGYDDPIPEVIREDFALVSLRDAYLGIHQPKTLVQADLARRRLIFDEFFYLQLGRLYQMLEGLGTKLEKDGLLEKYRNPHLNEVFVEEWSNLTRAFLRALPYTLTRSQLTAVSEIIWDLKRPVPMNRLLQGDVGCGKTIVAFLACMEVIGSGYQAAFMVPTELLAVQHYEHLLKLLESTEDTNGKPSIALLTGSTPSRQSNLIREGLKSGEISLVIGTHSLIADKVEFASLRIAIIDEQHRFGVIQRGLFNSKLYYNPTTCKLESNRSSDSVKCDGVMAPHVLTMSATPIPRTLALALYGDMSLTQITDLPPGRIPIETEIVEGNESGIEKVYQMMLDELEAGGKVYVVYPVIEQSEQLPQLRAAAAELETVSSRFPGYSCGLLHGKMKSDVKDDALRRFRSGETDILLSTQVIEIGVDIPDASMMVVMNAERFGIAQLHQIRGRVGRGDRKSKCILVASTVNCLNRLKVLEKSLDGFHLANMDLILRGPGDLLGKRQSGHLPEFPITRLEIDGNILQDAHLAALKILGISHDLESFPNLKAELSMRQPLCPLGD
ncbi:OLC1v1032026C1 [Oldenlandia corymbosa var. corymbosa]|uniref:DNA 3'-5' helicase n=1 Tax=Oldenlandia corymbosa var. corymbosa TaxID=529605 RepID=A0AAV1CKU4_OLDCO|nr:OLC1v1032026C1 [Oldenlandia corymbosa var. corymbosa]